MPNSFPIVVFPSRRTEPDDISLVDFTIRLRPAFSLAYRLAITSDENSTITPSSDNRSTAEHERSHFGTMTWTSMNVNVNERGAFVPLDRIRKTCFPWMKGKFEFRRMREICGDAKIRLRALNRNFRDAHYSRSIYHRSITARTSSSRSRLEAIRNESMLKLTWMNCIVIADFPTPPPPTTTSL